MKAGSLFVLCWWDPPNQDASDCVLDPFGKLSRRRGALAWFHGVSTCSVEVFEYWMICSLKIKLNRSWKFRRNWNVHLVLLERSRWAGFNGIYLVRFGFRIRFTISVCHYHVFHVCFLIAHYYNMVLSFGGEWDIESSNIGWISLCKCQKSDTRLYWKHISSKKIILF
jgi:hypothetical protein